ncbi:SLC13 family permease [Frigoriflavimonas asaccharolytica]|uniref:Di/tricarboxylate transporter n=1 Tax=Frigoriflavimonas asaccharolytica TaxID=2735899 RepID=A0A8J8K6J3_9FLAO|nr:SLC13 family permease [Frigoriflavimonas asaccharolytica]NRS93810.1 di/tricarboxylate transporter [Frigoriflavimonas asaccharolytica]
MKDKINFVGLFVAIAAFFILRYVPIPVEKEIQNALALLFFVAILWITESIPLSLTALLIPIIAIFLQLLPANLAFQEFANPIIFLFMGGFVLAGALSQYGLDGSV